jgi:hypothetical protein
MRLEVVPSDGWAAHVADLWVERLGADPALRMCLATGSTPVPVYEEMGRRVAAGEVSFAAATVFVLDEWLGLPTGHEVRCDTMLRRDLLQRVDLAEHRVHLFGVDTGDPAMTCELFDAAIRAGGGLDLAVLLSGASRSSRPPLLDPRSRCRSCVLSRADPRPIRCDGASSRASSSSPGARNSGREGSSVVGHFRGTHVRSATVP